MTSHQRFTLTELFGFGTSPIARVDVVPNEYRRNVSTLTRSTVNRRIADMRARGAGIYSTFSDYSDIDGARVVTLTFYVTGVENIHRLIITAVE